MAPELPGSRRTCPSTEERYTMRRASTCLAVLGLALIARLPSVASAAPRSPSKRRPCRSRATATPGTSSAPAPRSKPNTRSPAPNTADYPPPLIGVNFYLPKGAKITPVGLPDLPGRTSIKRRKGTSKAAPRARKPDRSGKSSASSPSARNPCPEEVDRRIVLRARRWAEFFTFGHDPASLEIPSTGNYTELTGTGGKGPELVDADPARRNGAGRPGRVGREHHGQGRLRHRPKGKHATKDTYYGTVPTKCPKGGFPLKTELIFAASAA